MLVKQGLLASKILQSEGRSCCVFEKEQPIHEMEDENWMYDLAFLVNVTMHLNDLNTKLQQNGQFANELYGYIKAFQNKLSL